ncbi:amidohydrolase [Bradyrhizobium sp. dw_78]|uniref:amidohydrolase family protein n=1 Tax=Bradyrhizobium sp. dw_78 TaxID=2719793 RepID=UPI001BD4A6E2|nr:amidohydrolase [Bradyrhizobium sp. dw_78]
MRQHIVGGLVLQPDDGPGRSCDLVVEDGRIKDIVPPQTPVADACRVDATERLIMPGLVNAHTHGQMSLSRGMNENWNLELLLNAFPWLGGRRNPEIHYVAALLSAAELVRKGCTAAYDLFSEFPAPTREGVEAVARAYNDIGMRAVIAPMMADRSFYQSIPGLLEVMPEPVRKEADGIRFASHQESIARCRSILQNWAFDRTLIRPALAPTIPHHCTDEFLIACRDLANDYEIGLQMHVAESRMQSIVAPRVHNSTAVSHLAKLGLLSPKFTAAHGVWLDDNDMSLLAEHGCSVSHNPTSNLRLGSGVARVRRMLTAGINVAIGTDAAVTSDTLNLFEAIRLAALVSRLSERSNQLWLSAREALHAGTVGGAKALGFGSDIGAIKVGAMADLVFLDLSSGPLVPLGNPVNQIVYGEDGSAIKGVMVAGKMLYENGKHLTIDYPNLVQRARSLAEDLIGTTASLKTMIERFQPIVGQYCSGLVADAPAFEPHVH